MVCKDVVVSLGRKALKLSYFLIGVVDGQNFLDVFVGNNDLLWRPAEAHHRTEDDILDFSWL